MKKYILISFLLFVSVLRSNAQNSLSMITNNPAYWFPATANLGDTVFFNVAVRNNNFLVFNDSLWIAIAVDTGSLVIIDYNYEGTIAIAGGDSAIFPKSVYVDPAVFSEGNNTVVIWPIYPNSGPPNDTLVNNTYIYNDVAEIAHLHLPRVYPNPTRGMIRFTGLEKPIEEVRISDLAGRLAGTYRNVWELDMGTFKPGVYFLTWEYEGLTLITRVAKE